MKKSDFAWVVGGPQGSGVDSAANLFAKAAAFGRLHVFGKREYYSNIMGEHSYFQVRVSEDPLYSHGDMMHLLASFEAETAIRHSWDVLPDGGILYDPKVVDTNIERVPTLEPEVRTHLFKRLNAMSLPLTVEGVLKAAEADGVCLFPFPYDDLVEELKREYPDTDAKVLKRMVNTMSVAASLRLVAFPFEFLEKSIQDVFKGKMKAMKMNIQAAQMAYDFVSERGWEFSCHLTPGKTDEKRIYVNGNQAVSLGKILGGCTFQSYYPITPASDESVFLEEHENFPLTGVQEDALKLVRNPGNPGKSASPDGRTGSLLVLQTEDEIAAIAAATGAALAGARAATATSGPGFCLMAEGLGWAGNSEVPVVVTLYQRGGPSTGLPTRHEQGDLLFAIFAGHGEFPRIVLSSGDLEEAFYDSALVFNLAEKYQMPVIHLLDKALANSNQTIPYYDLSRVRIERGALLNEAPSANGYQRFQFTESGISPRIRLGTPGCIFYNTGDEHTPEGHISEDPENRDRMMEKRMKKLDLVLKEIPRKDKFHILGDPDGDIVVLSWGTPKGAIREALEVLREEGHRVKFVQSRLLWPLPAQELKEELEPARLRIAIEQNYSGQFAGLVSQHTGLRFDHLVVKYNGRPMSFNEVLDALRGIFSGKSPKKVVLRRGH